jgi:hypothetical protein
MNRVKGWIGIAFVWLGIGYIIFLPMIVSFWITLELLQ